MGLRSGDWAGQSGSLISYSSNQILALLEICLGSLSCWKMTSSVGIPESSMLCNNPPSKMATYCLASILPSTSLKTPTPFHPIQPHTISDPPPNLTIPWTSLEVSPSLFLFHTYSCTSDPILLILVSSDQRTLFQSSTVQCWYLRAKANLLFLWETERRGFFFFTTAFREASFEGIPHCLQRDRSADDDIDEMGGLDCIAGLSSKDSLDNSKFVGRRELGGTTIMVIFFVWLDFLKDPSHSGLPYTSLGWNVSAGQIKRSKRDDMILLSSREVFHGGNEGIYLWWQGLYMLWIH